MLPPPVKLELYFNPRSPRGERLTQFFINIDSLNFNPRSPRGERRYNLRSTHINNVFQSTLPARGATLYHVKYMLHPVQFQSTLPARGATCLIRILVSWIFHFNPRSPRGERQNEVLLNMVNFKFQSTLPARGATTPDHADNHYKQISIHAPREGSDDLLLVDYPAFASISIHAPREGSDAGLRKQHPRTLDFNPRSPRGERQGQQRAEHTQPEFQSTLPARGATFPGFNLRVMRTDFNPRSPRGERLLQG